MTSNDAIMLGALLLILVPCVPLIWKMRPRHGWIYLLRGEEIASVLATAAIASIGVYDVAFVVDFNDDNYIALIANLLVMVTVSILLWTRLLQRLRHDKRNKQTIDSAIKQLAERSKKDPPSSNEPKEKS